MSAATENVRSVETMADLFEASELMRPLRRGDVVEGIVMRADGDGILVNIGHKAEGVIPPREMRSMSPEDLTRLHVGDEVMALVLRTESGEGAAILSIDKAVGERGWRTLEKIQESGKCILGKVAGFNRGGVIVEVEGIQGFVPMSQLVTISRQDVREAPPPQVGEPEGGEGQAAPPSQTPSCVGRSLTLKVLEVNRTRNRVICSEREAVREEREAKKAALIEELVEGEVRRGRVTGISSFGVFVDLGGADGLVHISELSWNPVGSPEEVVKVGDEVDAFVLRVDPEKKKIALSLRRLQPQPWDTVEERYRVGDIVDAVITKLTDFGAFARVEGCVEGLVHISELSRQKVNHPRDVVREGDAVKLKILRIEIDRRRMGLSLKQAMEEPYS